MRHQLPQPHPDLWIVELAVGQHGVVAMRQLEARGLDRAAVGRRVRAGRLHPVHRGVYSVGYPVLSGEGRLMAAVLACGRGGVASHRSAGAKWGIRPRTSRAEITVPRHGGHGRDGILVHDAALPLTHITELDGIPITTRARTLIDLADVLPRRALECAVDEADYVEDTRWTSSGAGRGSSSRSTVTRPIAPARVRARPCARRGAHCGWTARAALHPRPGRAPPASVAEYVRVRPESAQAG